MHIKFDGCIEEGILENGKYLDKKKIVVIKEWPDVWEWSGDEQPLA